MTESLLVFSVLTNVLLSVALVAIWTDKRAPQLVTPSKVAATPVEHVKAVKKPVKAFRAHKSFREQKQKFEDAHDPSRMSRQRVEKFAKAEE